MITDEKRREVADELRKQAAYSSGSLGEWWQRLQDIVTGEIDFANPQETYRAIANLIDPPAKGATEGTCRTCANYDGNVCVLDGFVSGSLENTCDRYESRAVTYKERREVTKELRYQAESWRSIMPDIRMSDRRLTDSIHMAFGLNDKDMPVHQALDMLADLIEGDE